MANYKSELQSNNADLTSILEVVNALPSSDTFAPLDSPAFTGTPKAPAIDGSGASQIATAADLAGGIEIVSGKYTGTGSTSWYNINLGAQPLAVFIKNAENNTSTQMLFCTRTNDAYDAGKKFTQANITTNGFRVRQAYDDYYEQNVGFANATGDHWYLAFMEV